MFLASKASRRSAGGLASALTIVDMPAAGHRFRRPTVAAMVLVPGHTHTDTPGLKKGATDGARFQFA